MSRRGRNPHARGGAIIAATWLIGLGLAFLIRDLAALGWGEAWPLFVIVAGCATLVSSLVGYRRLPAGVWSLAWPLAWIAIGALLLLSTTGAISAGPGDLVARWWPAALIGIGVWFLVASVWPSRTAPVETLNLPLAGATAAEVRIRFGAGQLSIERGAPGSLVSGTFSGGVIHRSRVPGDLEPEPDSAGGWPWWHTGLSWRVGLTGEVPLDLRLDCGASRSTIDLSDLLLRRFDLKTGASETRVLLPRAAGATWMRAEAGVAALTIMVPPGVAAHIRTRMALGSTGVDESRFPRTSDGYASPDFATSQNRVELEVQGGVGSVRIG